MKKLFAFLLATAMLLSMLAVTAFADIENVADSFKDVPTGVEFKEDATDGKYVRIPAIQSTIDKNMLYKNSAMNDDSKRYILIETAWRIPEVAKNGRNIVNLQFRTVDNPDGAKSWSDFLEIELRTGRIVLENGRVRTDIYMTFGTWNKLSVVIDRDTATCRVFLNDTLITVTSGEGETATVKKDFAIQNATAGFTIGENKLICSKVLNWLSAVEATDTTEALGKEQVKSGNDKFATTYDATFTDTTPYVDFKLIKCEMSTESHTHTFSTTYDNESGHADATNHYHWCTVEDCTVTDAGVAHTWNLEHATETEDKKCTVCGYIAENKTAHVHQMTEHAGTDATCTEAGTITYYVCSECEQWFKDQAGTEKIDDHANGIVIEALGHDPEEGVNAKEPTVDEEGYTGDTVCKRCNKTLKRGKKIETLDPEEVSTADNAESGTKAPETTENKTGDKGCKSGISAGLLCTVAILGTGITVLRKRK